MSSHEDYARAAAFDFSNPDGDSLLLLLHGLGGDRQQALGMVEHCSQVDVAMLAPDLRAHGETPLVGTAVDFGFDAMIEDIVALVVRLGQHHKPVCVAGISMGAALALRLTLKERLDIRGIALVRPAFDDTPVPSNLAVMPVAARLLRDDDPDVARQALLASPEYREIASVTASGARSVRDQLTKPHARERAIRLEEVPKNVAWHDAAELRKVEMPALVAGADRDVMHPIGLARRIAALLPDARLVEVVPRDVDAERYQVQLREAAQVHIELILQ